MLLELGLPLVGGFIYFRWLGHQCNHLYLCHKLITDPHRALSQIQARLDRPGIGVPTDMYRILHAGALSFIGEFEASWESLARVDRKRFCTILKTVPNPINQVIYYNSLLYSACLAERHDIAYEVWEQHRVALARFPDPGVEDTLGVFHYYQGNLPEARRHFEKVLKYAGPGASITGAIARGTSNYFLARLDLAEGLTESGLQRLQIAASAIPQSFVGQEPLRLAQGTERIPPPGSARRPRIHQLPM